MDKKGRLFLVDGHSLIFKMYYAFLRRPMRNSKGEDMSILYGVTKYILELIDREGPTHIAVAFDPPGGTFRNTIYPAYKANRPPTPQLVIDALEPMQEICRALRIPVLMVSGYEADDVIGTVARRAEDAGYTVYMVTPDKDYGQLISGNVLQYRQGKNGTDVLGVDEICEKYGIQSPAQVIEMLTLCGDSSDNVPGVDGVGEVGAGKLVAKYGSVQEIYAHLEELSPKLQDAFRAAEGHIALSHDLVTIRTDVEVDADFDAMRVDMAATQEIMRVFDRFEFSSLRRHFHGWEDVEAMPETRQEALQITISTPREIETEARKEGVCSIIVESRGDGIFSPLSRITVGVAPSFAASGSADDFRSLLCDETVAKIGCDLKAQCNLLYNNGVELRGKLLDIALMDYLINPEKDHGVDVLSRSLLGLEYDEAAADGAARNMSLFDDDADSGDDGEANLRRSVILARLGNVLSQKLKELSLEGLYDNMEEPLLHVLSTMECNGVKIDMAQLRQFASGLGAQLVQIQQQIREMAGEPNLNVLSTKQIGHVIFEKLALDPKVKAKTGARYSYSTDEATLTALADKHPIVDLILEYRALSKLLSTYIEPLPSYVNERTGKVHTTFNQALTATGRLSSSKPNLQNIPIRTERGREIRKAFVPSSPDGFIVSADYSQIELRIMAHLCGDSHLVEAFRAGRDVHAATAARIFGVSPDDVTLEQRRIAKTANFGIMYGISSFGLAQRLKISRMEAKRLIEDYFASFPSISSYIDKSLESVRQCGYASTLFGRRRYLPDISSNNGNVRAMAERNAINAPIQGTAADIIKKAMIEVDAAMRAEGLQSRMVLQIHDELVFDAVPGEVERLCAIAVEKMENVIELSVPLTVECSYGKNWLEAH